MPPWFADPQLRDALVVLLTLYPLMRILHRLGLSRQWVLLSLLSLVLPLLGHFLLALFIVSRPWPALPALPKPAPRRTS